VDTDDPVKIGLNNAILSGRLVDKGTLNNPSEMGILISVRPDPRLGSDGVNKKIGSLDSTNRFELQIEGLRKGTKYFFRTYAINEEGVGYGVVQDFKTLGRVSGKSWTSLEPSGIENWWTSPWFGSFYQNEERSGWIMHSDLGWLYPIASSNRGVWLWMERMGWLWTSKELYPYLYQNQNPSWVYFYGTDQETMLFYLYAEGKWLNYNKNTSK
jgi:hypothetical protein